MKPSTLIIVFVFGVLSICICNGQEKAWWIANSELPSNISFQNQAIAPNGDMVLLLNNNESIKSQEISDLDLEVDQPSLLVFDSSGNIKYRNKVANNIERLYFSPINKLYALHSNLTENNTVRSLYLVRYSEEFEKIDSVLLISNTPYISSISELKNPMLVFSDNKINFSVTANGKYILDGTLHANTTTFINIFLNNDLSIINRVKVESNDQDYLVSEMARNDDYVFESHSTTDVNFEPTLNLISYNSDGSKMLQNLQLDKNISLVSLYVHKQKLFAAMQISNELVWKGKKIIEFLNPKNFIVAQLDHQFELIEYRVLDLDSLELCAEEPNKLPNRFLHSFENSLIINCHHTDENSSRIGYAKLDLENNNIVFKPILTTKLNWFALPINNAVNFKTNSNTSNIISLLNKPNFDLLSGKPFIQLADDTNKHIFQKAPEIIVAGNFFNSYELIKEQNCDSTVLKINTLKGVSKIYWEYQNQKFEGDSFKIISHKKQHENFVVNVTIVTTSGDSISLNENINAKIDIEIDDILKQYTLSDTVICAGEKLTCTTQISPDSINNNLSYKWEFLLLDTVVNSAFGDSISVILELDGIYSIRLIVDNGFCSYRKVFADVVRVKNNPKFILLGKKSELCIDEVLNLRPDTFDLSFDYRYELVNAQQTFLSSNYKLKGASGFSDSIYLQRTINNGCSRINGFSFKTKESYQNDTYLGIDTLLTSYNNLPFFKWQKDDVTKFYSIKSLQTGHITQLFPIDNFTDQVATLEEQRHQYIFWRMDSCGFKSVEYQLEPLFLSESEDKRFLTWNNIDDVDKYTFHIGSPYFINEVVSDTFISIDTFTTASVSFKLSAVNADKVQIISNTLKLDFYANDFVPNAFSPNGDGLNDVFKVDIKRDINNYLLEVYAKNGQLLFSTNNVNEYWDGTVKNQVLPADSYKLKLSYEIDGDLVVISKIIYLIR